jgi:hypothetical protein
MFTGFLLTQYLGEIKGLSKIFVKVLMKFFVCRKLLCSFDEKSWQVSPFLATTGHHTPTS